MKVLKQKNTLEKFIINAETYIEPRQISTMDLFGLTVFAKKSHYRFSVGFKIRSCKGRRYLKVAFSKIPKMSQEITILEYSFSKVAGLKETCNSYFCVTPKNHRLMFVLKSTVTKKATVCFYNFGEENF